MSENAEGGIAAVQSKAAQNEGLQKHHKSTISYLDERIFGYFFMVVIVGLLLVWMSDSSPYITYGSTGAVILVTLLWGALHIKRNHQIREQRNLQVKEMQSRS